jgi:hypothetical protein
MLRSDLDHSWQAGIVVRRPLSGLSATWWQGRKGKDFICGGGYSNVLVEEKQVRSYAQLKFVEGGERAIVIIDYISGLTYPHFKQ